MADGPAPRRAKPSGAQADVQLPNGGKSETVRFLRGAAISVWQNSGDNDSNWTRFAKSRWPFRYFGVSAIRGKYNIDTNSNFWDK
jgi:hypothetical protein